MFRFWAHLQTVLTLPKTGRFEALLKQLHIKQPVGDTVHTAEEAIETANRLGYPVLLRPSYVLGGQNMIIAFSDADVKEYMDIILSHMEGNIRSDR